MSKQFCHGFALLMLASTHPALASPLPPCLKAASSSNGNVLVIIEAQQASREQPSLQVFLKERWINAKDRLTAPNVYWTNSPLWSVPLDGTGPNSPSCPLPLVTDDGEFLILLTGGYEIPDQEAIRIYRRRDHIGDPIQEGPDHGVLVKSILIKEILPAVPPDTVQFWTDASPQWFAGSTFDLSADNRQLILNHRPDGAVLRIDLNDGSIRRD